MAEAFMKDVAQSVADKRNCDALKAEIHSAQAAASACDPKREVTVKGKVYFESMDDQNTQIACRKRALEQKGRAIQVFKSNNCTGDYGGKRKSKRSNKKRRSSRRKSSKSRRRR